MRTAPSGTPTLSILKKGWNRGSFRTVSTGGGGGASATGGGGGGPPAAIGGGGGGGMPDPDGGGGGGAPGAAAAAAAGGGGTVAAGAAGAADVAAEAEAEAVARACCKAGSEMAVVDVYGSPTTPSRPGMCVNCARAQHRGGMRPPTLDSSSSSDASTLFRRAFTATSFCSAIRPAALTHAKSEIIRKGPGRAAQRTIALKSGAIVAQTSSQTEAKWLRKLTVFVTKKLIRDSVFMWSMASTWNAAAENTLINFIACLECLAGRGCAQCAEFRCRMSEAAVRRPHSHQTHNSRE